MAEIHGGNIVTDGLVLYLDANNIKSYPKTGTTWYDLSGYRNNFTIDASNISWNGNGYFMLNDGGVYYNNIITTSTTATMQFWINTLDVQSLFWHGQTNSFYVGAYRISNKEYYSGCGSPNFYLDCVETVNIYDYVIDGNWHMCEFKNINFSTWTTNNFNKYSSYKFDNTKISKILMYNRNLTLNESIINYNTIKSKINS